jgi:hypothetical protein
LRQNASAAQAEQAWANFIGIFSQLVRSHVMATRQPGGSGFPAAFVTIKCCLLAPVEQPRQVKSWSLRRGFFQGLTSASSPIQEYGFSPENQVELILE